MSLSIEVNGEAISIASDTTVQQIVADRSPASAGRPGRGVAVAVNGEVVPRSLWAETRLRPGDRVELLNAVGGG